MFKLFKSEENPAVQQLSTRQKAIKILETLIESGQVDINKSELSTYKDAIETVEDPGSRFCKVYILNAIRDVRLKAGEEDSKESYEAITAIATKIVDSYNTENPDKEQFSNMATLYYVPQDMQVIRHG